MQDFIRIVLSRISACLETADTYLVFVSYYTKSIKQIEQKRMSASLSKVCPTVNNMKRSVRYSSSTAMQWEGLVVRGTEPTPLEVCVGVMAGNQIFALRLRKLI